MLEILPDFEILRNVELIFDGEIMRNTQEMPRVGVVFSMRLNEGQMFSLKFVGSATAAQRQMPHTRPNPRKLAHCNVIVGSPQEAIGFTMVTGESSQESHLSFFLCPSHVCGKQAFFFKLLLNSDSKVSLLAASNFELNRQIYAFENCTNMKRNILETWHQLIPLVWSQPGPACFKELTRGYRGNAPK